jgi:hypothetical protein
MTKNKQKEERLVNSRFVGLFCNNQSVKKAAENRNTILRIWGSGLGAHGKRSARDMLEDAERETASPSSAKH